MLISVPLLGNNLDLIGGCPVQAIFFFTTLVAPHWRRQSIWLAFLLRLLIETRQWQAAARGDTSLTRQHPRDDGSGTARRDSGLHTATRHTALSVLGPRTTPWCLRRGRAVFGRPPSATRLLFLIVGIFVDANRFGDGVMAPRSAAEYNTGPRCESGGAPRISLVLFFSTSVRLQEIDEKPRKH